jgi:hypothetical protein
MDAKKATPEESRALADRRRSSPRRRGQKRAWAPPGPKQAPSVDEGTPEFEMVELSDWQQRKFSDALNRFVQATKAQEEAKRSLDDVCDLIVGRPGWHIQQVEGAPGLFILLAPTDDEGDESA